MVSKLSLLLVVIHRDASRRDDYVVLDQQWLTSNLKSKQKLRLIKRKVSVWVLCIRIHLSDSVL